jgi:hypothetical protein
MGLEDEVIKACKGIIRHQINNAAELRRTLLDKCITSAIAIFDCYNKKCVLQGIKATSNYIDGCLEVNYNAESINGTITIMDIEHDKTCTKPDKDTLIAVTCKAHSCVTQSFYKGEIPEADIIEFIKYATRGPTFNDRWRRMAGYYHGEF